MYGQFIARFNLAWHLTVYQYVSFSIKAYIHLSLDEPSKPNDDKLNLALSGFRDRFGRLGLNFVFCSGPRT
ncbi:MAG: hypothetical protein EBS24_04580 [Chitinophagia bacterium]|nr:hypothetical protein [Chitinophagia bacterium]